MKYATVFLLALSLTACLEGPVGPEGPQGEAGISPSAASVAGALIRDHLADIEGPQGDPGTTPTAEETAAVLVRDHLATITGPTGQDGTSPTPATVAQELVTSHLPTIRGPAGAYDAVDASGDVIGRVTGLGSYLWSEAAQGFFWMPKTDYLFGPSVFWLAPPPGMRVLFANGSCTVSAGQVFVDMSAGTKSEYWIDPLILGAWSGSTGVRGSLTAPRADGVTILSYNDGDLLNCQPLNEVRSNLIAFDTPVSMGPWNPPMTLVPATQ